MFAWKFRDGEPISPAKFFLSLLEIFFPGKTKDIFPMGIPTELTRENILRVGMTIFEQFKASILLILDHADTLKRAAAKGEENALALVDLFKETSVKILATSQEPLGWPGENIILLNGFVDSDTDSGRHLFIRNLTTEARNWLAKKTEGYTKENTERLLYDLVTNVDGHPHSLMLLSRAVSEPQHFTKSLENIIYEHYSTLISEKDLKDKSLKEHFRPKIEKLETRQRLFIYLCSFVAGPVTVEALVFASYFSNYVGETMTEEVQEFVRDLTQNIRSRMEAIVKYLEQSCLEGLLEKNESKQQYKIHAGFREAVRQHNVELGLRLRLPIIGSFDSSFVAGISLEQGEQCIGMTCFHHCMFSNYISLQGYLQHWSGNYATSKSTPMMEK